MKLKNRPIDILIGIALVYLFIGLGVVSIQTLSGAKCGPIRLGGEWIYAIDRDAPRFWLTRALAWLPTAYDNLFTKDVPTADFFSPKTCLWESDSGKIEDPNARRE